MTVIATINVHATKPCKAPFHVSEVVRSEFSALLSVNLRLNDEQEKQGRDILAVE